MMNQKLKLWPFICVFVLSFNTFGYSQTIPSTVTLPDSIGDPNLEVNWVKSLNRYCEGPAVDTNGDVYFTEQRGQNTMDWPIWKMTTSNPSDTGMIFVLQSDQANGLQFDVQWRLVAAQKGKITRYNKNGSVDALLAESGSGATFNMANDLGISSDGSLYFTDLNTDIFYVSPTGQLSSVMGNAGRPNGIEFLEESNSIVVNEIGNNRVSWYQQGTNGSLTNRSTFVNNISTPDGATFDEHGNYYSASWTDGVVYVYNGAGEEIGSIAIHTPNSHDVTNGQRGNTSNCSFGGPENKTLYITGDGGLFSVQLKIAGRRIPGQPLPVNNMKSLRMSSFNIIPIYLHYDGDFNNLIKNNLGSNTFKLYNLNNQFLFSTSTNWKPYTQGLGAGFYYLIKQ